jgi:hypothetical protein
VNLATRIDILFRATLCACFGSHNGDGILRPTTWRKAYNSLMLIEETKALLAALERHKRNLEGQEPK